MQSLDALLQRSLLRFGRQTADQSLQHLGEFQLLAVFAVVDDLARFDRRRVVGADVIEQVQRLRAPSTVSASRLKLLRAHNGNTSQARNRDAAVMNESQMEMRSYILFTSNAFHSSVVDVRHLGRGHEPAKTEKSLGHYRTLYCATSLHSPLKDEPSSCAIACCYPC